jgi:hypothetical protein
MVLFHKSGHKAIYQCNPFCSIIVMEIIAQEVIMRRIASFFIGAIIGGVVGSGLALLFAPASGEELRVQINERAQAFANNIRQAASTKRIELQERLVVLRAPRQ